MTKTSITPEEFKHIREFIEQSCGISLGDNKEYLVETRLSDILSEAGCETYKDLCLKAKKEVRSGLRDKIVDAMTTNETLWFRDKYPFDILRNVIFPAYNKELLSKARQNVRIWCAACSTGQEPYSTVMTLFEYAKKTHRTQTRWVRNYCNGHFAFHPLYCKCRHVRRVCHGTGHAAVIYEIVF